MGSKKERKITEMNPSSRSTSDQRSAFPYGAECHVGNLGLLQY